MPVIIEKLKNIKIKHQNSSIIQIYGGGIKNCAYFYNKNNKLLYQKRIISKLK